MIGVSEPTRRLDLDELENAMRRGGAPTVDDVTVLRDGTRLDTPEKARAWIEETVRRIRAAIKAASAGRDR